MALLGWDQVWELFRPRTFFTMCSTVSSVRLNGRIAQHKKSRSNICTKHLHFSKIILILWPRSPRMQNKVCRSCSTDEMSKIKSEPKLAECQNLERSPTSSAELSIKCRSYGGWRGSHSYPRGNLRTSSTLPSTLLSIIEK